MPHKRASNTRKSKMPQTIEPMLCTLVTETPSSTDFAYEIKWDGYRIIAYVQKGVARLASRGGKDYTAKYPLIARALEALGHDMVLDGEVVVFDQDGNPDFQAIQNYNGKLTPISYSLFDILWLDGNNLMEEPLEKRKATLDTLIRDNDTLLFSESFDDGPGLYQQMIERGMEGIVAKKRDSPYLPGNRGGSWLKIPTRIRQEFVIGAYAESEKGRAFRSLLFGAYNSQGKFEWIGRSGGGFKEKEMASILSKLKKLEIKSSPFTNKILDTKGAIIHYVKPVLVANFEFAAWTESGRIRKPATFLSFRSDKDPKTVVREVPKELKNKSYAKTTIPDISPVIHEMLKAKKKPTAKYLNTESNWTRVDEEQKNAEWFDFEMENCTVPVHNLEREVWTDVPKGKLLIYYNQISSLILPYLRDRPQSLNLKLTHAGGPTTFVKDMENREPECATVFQDKRRVKKPGKRNQIDYLVINNTETLIYAIDVGCVDINPWASTIKSPNSPDQIWIDLDPTLPNNLKGDKLITAEDDAFKKAIEVCRAAKEILDKHKLKSFPKTSGKTGMHIYIPCSGIDFHQSRLIASVLADEIHQLVPSISTRNETITQRANNVYIDAGQNDYADTLAAPYSIRPYHQPLISTPLDWQEVNAKLDRWKFTMDNIAKRIKLKGEMFAGVLDSKIAKVNTKRLQVLLP